MGNKNDGDFQEGATLEVETPIEEVQPKEFTPEELRDILMGELRPDLDAFYRGVQSRIDHLESQLNALPEVLGAARQAQTYAKKVASSTLPPEDIQAMEQAEETETLRKQLEVAKANVEVWQRAAMDAVAEDDKKQWIATKAKFQAYIKSQGLASDDGLELPTQRYATPSDPRGFQGWLEAAQQIADAEVDRLAKAARPQAPITTQRPAGDTGEMLQTLVNKAGTGGDLTSAEMAQVAKALAAGYTVKRRR